MFKKIKELNKKKFIILTLATLIVLVGIMGTTIAWLSSNTNLLVNTFTYGDIKISLIESDTGDGDDDENTNSYEMTPGNAIIKDTLVKVYGGSEDCWLFIKLTKENEFDKYMTYSLESIWLNLEGYEDVYYTKVNKSDKEQTFNVMKDNMIKVKEELTYADLINITETNYPSLEIKAYAVQRNENMENINTPEKAWELAHNQAN